MQRCDVSIELAAVQESKDEGFQVTIGVNDDMWTVRRTLDEFQSLDSRLKAQHAAHITKDETLAKTLCLPDTESRSSTPTDFSAYLRAVVARPMLFNSEPVAEFLGGGSRLQAAMYGTPLDSGVDGDAEDENPCAVPAAGQGAPTVDTLHLPKGVSATPLSPPPLPTTGKATPVAAADAAKEADLTLLLRKAITESLSVASAASSSHGAAGAGAGAGAGAAGGGSRMFTKIALVPYTPDAVFELEPLPPVAASLPDGPADVDADPTAPSPASAAARVTALKYVGGWCGVPPTPPCSPCGSPVRASSPVDGVVLGVDLLADENPCAVAFVKECPRPPPSSPVCSSEDRRPQVPSAMELSAKLAAAAAAGELTFRDSIAV